MDDGYRMLQHVVRQVFGNLGQAARLTLLLTAGPMLVILYFSAQTVPGPGGMPQPENPGLILVFLLVNVVTTSWAAVGWHRYVLREEYGTGLVPQWRGQNIRSYIGRLIILSLALIAAAIAFFLVLVAIMTVAQSPTMAWILGLGAMIGFSWLIVRLGLILPAAAVGERLTLRESWAETRPVSTDILVPVVVLAIAFSIVSGAITSVFGTALAGFVVSALVYWVQILLNLSLMTTVYGMQIEGRALQ
jgi:hypothetical protein